MSRDVAVVIPAAGMGRRMGGVRKALMELAGEPLLSHTLRPFLLHPDIGWVVVVLAAGDAADPPEWLRTPHGAGGPEVRVVAGGAERGDSVRAGVDTVPPEAAVILVHDAARPLVSRAVIDRTVDAARRGTGAVAAVRVADTIKEADAEGRITATLDRERLWRIQTPQGFPAATLRRAYARAAEDAVHATDDAALVERYGGAVVVVEGAAENFKVTTPFDHAVAEMLLRARAAGSGAAPGGAREVEHG